MLLSSIHSSLDELVYLLNQLSNNAYSESCKYLSDASIGEHTRHILEMFQCLEESYDSGILNYDNRKRNKCIESDTHYAKQIISDIKQNFKKENKSIYLQQIIDKELIEIQSNYYRELLYNLEHCIHHQALIKVAVLQCENVIIDENFGVARSTIEYRNQCAQ
ncbi:DinB family protein [Flavobacterium sp. T12S277]|uniref:DinB family protein n=1 Tax=Flavobacterium sp. T12S277 TaxID=3402752 RepID=UPI003ADB7283